MENQANRKAPPLSRKVDKYWVPMIAKTIDLLDCLTFASSPMTLEEVVQQTGIPHTTAYRILHTLVLRDYLMQSGRQYRLNRLRKRLKLGFANLSKQICLAVEIERSLRDATSAAGIDLLVWDNDRSADVAIHNAEEMAESKLDLAIEFQLYEHVAPVISDILSRAGTPLISLVNPHHGNTYFGVNNYRAGYSAGLALASFAAQHWKSQPDSLLLMESPRAGRTVQSRLIGAVRGVQERLGPIPENKIEHIDGGGDTSTSKTALNAFLRSRPKQRILIAAINDESAMGAVEAAQSRSASSIAIVGHGGSAEMLDVIADPENPCIGTVSFHAERYGEEFLAFALPIVQGRSTAAAHYVAHEFIGKDKAAQIIARRADSVLPARALLNNASRRSSRPQVSRMHA